MGILTGIVNNSDPSSLSSKLRRKRTEIFWDLVKDLPEPVRILDVGGTVGFWTNNAGEAPKRCEITVMNLAFDPEAVAPSGFTLRAGDARRMPEYEDGEFDICFSNSVIEHVGTLYDQMSMAKEIQRVGRRFFVQTPNRYFPIEPHFLVPFWQFLPAALRGRLLNRFEIGWMKREINGVVARAEVEQIRLLVAAEMQYLFPKSVLYREKIGGLTKSLIAHSVV